VEIPTAGTETELDTAFTTMVGKQVDAVIAKADPFFISPRRRLVALAARNVPPAIYPLPLFVEVGGLMSYGTSLMDSYEQVGVYVGRIGKGATPVDLPIQQGTKFETSRPLSARSHPAALVARSRRPGDQVRRRELITQASRHAGVMSVAAAH